MAKANILEECFLLLVALAAAAPPLPLASKRALGSGLPPLQAFKVEALAEHATSGLAGSGLSSTIAQRSIHSIHGISSGMKNGRTFQAGLRAGGLALAASP